MGGWTPVETEIEERAGLPVVRMLPGPSALPRQHSGPSVQGSLGKVEMQSHLPSSTLEGLPHENVVMSFRWSVRNRGQVAGHAGLKIVLKTDSAIRDDDQLVLEASGARRGNLAPVTAVVSNSIPSPLQVPPEAEVLLVTNLLIPVANMIDRQNSVSSFNWWVFVATVWDMDTDQQVALGPSRHEGRDWLRVDEVPGATPTQLEASGLPDPLVVVSVEIDD